MRRNSKSSSSDDKNSCNSRPCLNNAKCQHGFTAKTFRCLCPAGFEGELCERDINQCTAGTHNCSVNALCTNTVGGFICTCCGGFVGDGVNCTVSACSNDGPCRKLAFPSFLFFADKRLMNHTIKTLKVRDLDVCELRCYYEHNCVSVNVENKMLENGKYNCELNNSTHGEHDEDFVEAPNFLYRGTNNPCGSSPCKNNGTCQSGFTKKGYHCLCRGWTGARCQEDIDECYEKSHECSKNADCENTEGSYKCKCKTGFQGDGYNCTDIDECEKKRCGTNANYTNTEGSFRCTCNIGYYGDGYNCTECCTIFDFEDHDLSNWTLNGTAFNNQPTYGNNTLAREGRSWSNYKGDWWIGTFENRSSPSEPFGGNQGDNPQGSMTSPSFQITGKFLTFLIGAGCGDNAVRAELIVDGVVVCKETPATCDEAMKEKNWNVTGYAGKHAQLRLVDHYSDGWGHINFDHLQACHKIISDTDS